MDSITHCLGDASCKQLLYHLWRAVQGSWPLACFLFLSFSLLGLKGTGRTDGRAEPFSRTRSRALRAHTTHTHKKSQFSLYQPRGCLICIVNLFPCLQWYHLNFIAGDFTGKMWQAEQKKLAKNSSTAMHAKLVVSHWLNFNFAATMLSKSCLNSVVI